MRSEARVVITNPTGLHARPAVKLARLAAGFDANIEVRTGNDGQWVRARSTSRVMKLKAGARSTLHFRAEGSEADDALSALVDLVRRDFDEGPAAAAGPAGTRGRSGTGPSPYPDRVRAQPKQESRGCSDSGPPPQRAFTDAAGAADTMGAGSAADVADEPEERAGNPTGKPADAAREGRATPADAAREGRATPTDAAREGRATPTDAAREGRATPTDVVQGGRAIPAVTASPGLAIGTLHVLVAPGTGAGVCKPGDPGIERATFDAAVAGTIERLRALADASGDLGRDVIGFQIGLLEDEEFLGPVREEIDAGAAAARTWLDHLAGEIADYESASTSDAGAGNGGVDGHGGIADCESASAPCLRDRAADLRDLRERVATALAGDATPDPNPNPGSDPLPEQCVVIAEELTPSRFLELDRSRVVAVATLSGSIAGHAAMLARAHGMPMLVQLACDAGEAAPGMEAVVDADEGRLVLAPPPALRKRYALRIEERRARERKAMEHASRPARTRAGTRVRVLVNVDDPAALTGADPSHCDGIGLTRTELLFRCAAAPPDEETQLGYYRRLVAWAEGRPVTVRTLDAGGDKPIPGLTIDGESNPFLGLRGVRLSLAYPEVFATQLRALARAAACGEIKVMLPMVTKPDELDEARRLLSAEVRALRSAGVDAALPRLGMMVEVPAAALTIEAFDADFYSIGTNDLTQYVLAAARDSTAVAGLLDPLHPAVLELIERVARAGGRAGREVSVCGEMASRPECLRALLDAGIRVVSVPPAAVVATRAAVAALP